MLKVKGMTLLCDPKRSPTVKAGEPGSSGGTLLPRAFPDRRI